MIRKYALNHSMPKNMPIAALNTTHLKDTAMTQAQNMNLLTLIQPVAVERDANGYWSHPGIPEGDDDIESQVSFKAWMKSQCLAHHISSLENEDESLPAYHAYYEKEVAGVVGWNSTPPEGDGWFTFSIHDTEDGPVWVWVRRVENSEAA